MNVELIEICIDVIKMKGEAYKEIQIVRHIMEQSTDHCG